MHISEFDFQLPDHLIATEPCVPRTSARLLFVPDNQSNQDLKIADIPSLLSPGDVLVINNTKVIRAKLQGECHGKRISVNLHKAKTDRADNATTHKMGMPSPEYLAKEWYAFVRPAKKVQVGDCLHFGAGAFGMLTANILEKNGGELLLSFNLEGQALAQAMEQCGDMPLPPYIEKKRAQNEQDDQDYQTVYADIAGAVAAPTAGLHFTDSMLAELQQKGIKLVTVTLHVGAGTFLPVKVEQIHEHHMHSEWGQVSQEAVDIIQAAKQQGKKVVAVGTTSLRILESAYQQNGQSLQSFAGDTDIFITPGYAFGVVDVLMTNFHLPKSTLFMLVSAFSGLARMQAAYAHAMAQAYRFYSYGDACWLEKAA